MARVLYLVHRMPYPPDKGDKVRSYHLLRHLARQHEVYLGTFVDDPQDFAHLPMLRRWCAEVHAQPLNPRMARVRSLSGLLRGEALTLAYYRSAHMMRWVREVVQRVRPDVSVVFSSSMAPYALEAASATPLILDFVDMDSAKWSEYAQRHRQPLAWVYAREGRLLGGYERQVARLAQHAYFVAEQECGLFLQQAPDCAPRVRAVGNGVDADHFSPGLDLPNPFADGERAVVFTGAMDYWPNVDAVVWFAQEILPHLVQRFPAVRFHIVGRGPTEAVRALQGERVRVTGTVPDVRPYLRHAAAVVAPMRLARGIQNKVLEGMAMGAAVVAARSCVQALELHPQDGVVAADSVDDYVQTVLRWLKEPDLAQGSGRQARQCVERRFSWESHLGALDLDLQSCLRAEAATA